MRQLLARSILFLGLTLLASCAGHGPAGFDQTMSTYVGQPEVRLVEGLGVPQRVYETEGRRFLEYDFGSKAVPASSGFSFGLGAGSFGGGRYGRGGGIGTGIGIGIPLGGSGYEAAPCIVTFEVRDDRVLDFRRQGESCR
ncbi:hypothetical protein [Teichococcus aestuarii]|uniref:hypothetical protein n=2 Tax=Teichococcus aestuarii TaxID=568898 RepID=UPI0011B252D3|nr:hypothetical protein [Pseudoroseomonas aestuarii]